MNTTLKILIFWLVILGSAMALWLVVKSQSSSRDIPEISYSEFMSQVGAGNVATVTINGTNASGIYRNGSRFSVVVPTSQDSMLAALQQKGVEVRYTDANSSPASWLINLAPLTLLAVLWFYMIRRMRGRKDSSPPAGPSATSNAPWP